MEDIKIIYSNYEEIILINYFNNIVIKKNNEKGKFIINNNILKIKWIKKNIEEKFIYNNNISYNDYLINTYNFIEVKNLEIYIVHKDWEETCIIDDDKIFKKNDISYCGSYYHNENYNFMLISWLNSVEEKYIKKENKYCISEMNNEINLVYYYNKNILNDTFILDNKNTNIYNKNTNNVVGNYNIDIKNNILIVNWKFSNDKFYYKDLKKYYYSEYLLNNYFKIIKININNIKYNYIINTYNNKIFNENDFTILFDYKEIDEIKFSIKLNEKYDFVFELDNENIYNNVTEKYNENILIVHKLWNDTCIINKYNKYIYRNKNKESGKYEIINDKLIIYWEIWDQEIFINIDDIYYYQTNELIIQHKDWNTVCIIENLYIYRKDNRSEYGKYSFDNNKLTIYWEKWDNELFYKLNDIYYYQKCIKILIYNNKEYLYVLNNNKLYNNFNNYEEFGNINIDDIYVYIDLYINNIEEKFYYKYENNYEYIILYKNIYKDICVIKDFEEILTINLLDNKIKNNSKEGIYEYIDNEYFNIYWNLSNNNELYQLIDEKYYCKEYLDIQNKNILLINNNNHILYRINIFKNYIYNNDIKIQYLKNNDIYYIIENDILEIYYLYSIDDNNLVLLINNIHEKFKNDIVNLNIYKISDNKLSNLNNLELFINLINNNLNNKIYSIKTFLKKYAFFDIYNYCKNNNINSIEDGIIHWYNIGINNIFFYSNNNIEIIYDNLYDKYDENNEYDNKDIYIYDYEDNLLNESLPLVNQKINILDNYLFIINLKNNNYLEKILNYLPKNINIIININFNYINFFDIKNILNKKFTNLIITKSKQNENYSIVYFIVKNILIKKNIFYNKIIYLNNDIIDIDDINYISTIINKNEIITLDDEYIIYNKYDKYNYLYFCKNLKINIISIIEILIFYYIIKKNIYNIFNHNFIINFDLLKNILYESYSKNISILQ